MPDIKKKAKIGVINDWDLMERQVWFYRDHLDIFIEEQFPPIKLTPSQKIIVRQFGRCDDMSVVCSRGYGKTFVIALAAFAMCCLWPGTTVMVCSATAQQATLVNGKIKDLVERNENMRKELTRNGARSYVRISKNDSLCEFKNGSRIQSQALSSVRGTRAKIIVIDEALLLNLEDLEAALQPCRNTRRQNVNFYGALDFTSKSIKITSASPKANEFYGDFRRILADFGNGRDKSFACSLSYETAIAEGLGDAEYFESERRRVPSATFDMEYGSIFVGGSSNSVFPMDLTDTCRNLYKIELLQPKNGKGRYVIGVDIATSSAKGSDHTVVSVVKFTEKPDYTYSKKLVWMRSYEGLPLDKLAEEVREIYHVRFPNAEKIVYDARGVGNAFARFFLDSWIDPQSGKEYPPLVHEDEGGVIPGAKPILKAVNAVLQFNQQIAINLKTMFETRSLEIPLSTRIARIRREEEGTPFAMEEEAVFMEADALQVELSYIVAKISQSGNTIYDTEKARQHKDRYSSLAYACDYISTLEEANVKKHKNGIPCIGIASAF